MQRDSVSGDFILEFTDIDGVRHRMVVEPRNKLSPRMAVAIESSGQPEFEFSFRDAWLEPGQSVGHFVVRPAWLPAPASAWVFGRASLAKLPVSVGSVPDPVIDLLQDIQGIDFNSIGGREVHTLVPARAPAMLDDPGAALSLIRGDLERISGELAWITDAGVWRSLGEELAAASESLTRFWARKQRARRHLEAFLRDLEAHHGAEAGKDVNDSAYALLKINVQYVLGRL